jgi:hypothetical protein
VRFDGDDRVFLGYRAGGANDFYKLDHWDVWASHLGLAVLDECGERVMHRLPMPIMTKIPRAKLPQNKEEYETYMKSQYKDDICVLHDFRFFSYNGYLNIIYHEGPIHSCYDCVVRMPVKTFITKVDESLALAKQPAEEIKEQWAKLWWGPEVWEPCGVNGTNRIFSSPVHKGDIVYFELGDGTLQMCHRPLADAVAVLNTGKDLFATATADGLTKYGVYETCTRPGFTDNSHIGNNGLPTRAKIDDVDVYIDVTHGCFDQMIADKDVLDHKILYYPYFRVKDYQTGELLYYSQNPILYFDEVWREYAEDGAWVSKLPHLDGVMFVGGQIETQRGKNGLDDEFILYSGLGDTAIGTAKFSLRQLLPAQVIEDIKNRKAHQRTNAESVAINGYKLEQNVNGWEWIIENDPYRRNLRIVRSLKVNGSIETDARIINSVPGGFDADAVIWDGTSIKFIKDVGWVIVYKGVRWDQVNGEKTSAIGYGLLVLDKDNPEKVLYRTSNPEGPVFIEKGWTLKAAFEK